MFRMNGMPRAQGCAGAALFRMNGMPRAQEAHDCKDKVREGERR